MSYAARRRMTICRGTTREKHYSRADCRARSRAARRLGGLGRGRLGVDPAGGCRRVSGVVERNHGRAGERTRPLRRRGRRLAARLPRAGAHRLRRDGRGLSGCARRSTRRRKARRSPAADNAHRAATGRCQGDRTTLPRENRCGRRHGRGVGHGARRAAPPRPERRAARRRRPVRRVARDRRLCARHRIGPRLCRNGRELPRRSLGGCRRGRRRRPRHAGRWHPVCARPADA